MQPVAAGAHFEAALMQVAGVYYSS
ncbi:hypothetical protein DSM3645_16950 [Blastopirellula marina DSM 3645]|uniref:Uncharacterized protein n=1 Tax=Blastopirellula marina DSM 3645 TaxID=314230 RepID=A3ZNG5_9BACT|nr:hypothetical protein DSM3645_16950 [Blastopirellula marina DSM 3645]